MRYLLVIVGTLLLASCQREQTWICEDVTTITNYETTPPVVKVDKSGYSKTRMTEKEIRKYEKDNYSYTQQLNDSNELHIAIERKVDCQ